MSFLITLSSDDRDTARFPDSGDFSIIFSDPIELGSTDRPWEMAYVSGGISYSFPNVSATLYNNAQFTYNNGVVDKSFTIEEGTYTFAALNSAIQAGITALGDVGTNIELLPNYSTFKTILTTLGGYTVDFSTSDLYQLFGFSAAQIAAPLGGTVISANVADITRSVDTLLIRCDIVAGSVNGREAADVVYSFIPDTFPGGVINVFPPQKIYLPINPIKQIQRMRVYITDQLNRPVNFRGETTSYMFHLRHRRG